MRVGIDATTWANARGYGRFTRGLVTALLAAPSAHEFVLFVDDRTEAAGGLPAGARRLVVPTRVQPIEAASAAGRRSLTDLLALSRAVGRERLDVLFYPSVYTYFPAITRATVIVGIHDVIAEEYPELIFPGGRGRFFWGLKSAVARWQSDWVLTVSEEARVGIVRRFGYPVERIWVAGEAADAAFRPLGPDEIDRALLASVGLRPQERFLVYMGGINPHKNLERLVEALARLRRDPIHSAVRLVIVGELRKDVFTPGLEALHARISLLGLEQAVLFTGFLSDARAAHVLNTAQALVLSSMAEGFGLPAVEAAACGTPVVATRNSPLPRLLEGGGLFVDPTSVDALESALRIVLGDEPARRAMGLRALERARGMTWEASARQFDGLLAAIAQGRR